MKHPLLEQLERAWAGDGDLLVSLYDDPCTFEDKAFNLAHHGHAGIREVFAFTFAIMPDFRVVYGPAVIGPDAGAAEWVFTGTFRGDYNGRTFAPTPVRIEGISFMQFRNGKIARNADYWNVGSLDAQLGG